MFYFAQMKTILMIDREFEIQYEKEDERSNLNSWFQIKDKNSKSTKKEDFILLVGCFNLKSFQYNTL